MKISAGELVCYHETHQNVYNYFTKRKEMQLEEILSLQKDIYDTNGFYTSKEMKMQNDFQTKLFRVQQLRKEIQRQYARTFGNEMDVVGLKAQYQERDYN